MSLDPSNTEQLAQLQKQVLELQLASIRKDVAALASDLDMITSKAAEKTDLADHEKRIRTLEESSTKVNTLIWLVTGGGLLSAINLFLFLSK